jgi:hypothetical protein
MSRTASQLRTQARRLDRVYLQMADLVRVMRDEGGRRPTRNGWRMAAISTIRRTQSHHNHK